MIAADPRTSSAVTVRGPSPGLLVAGLPFLGVDEDQLEPLLAARRLERDLERHAGAAEPTPEVALTAAHDAAVPIHPEERQLGPGDDAGRRLGQARGTNHGRLPDECPAEVELPLVGPVRKVGRDGDRRARGARGGPQRQDHESQRYPAARATGQAAPRGHGVSPPTRENAPASPEGPPEEMRRRSRPPT